jgi:plastocyanin
MSLHALRNHEVRARAGRAWVALAMLWLWPLVCVAGSGLSIRVTGADAALEDAVVSLHPLQLAPPAAGVRAVMDQRKSAFVPGVLPVQAGTRVEFPNSDQIRHQVYSFSRAKPFELPLYAGSDAPPVLFDRPGVVVVGCNIHDFMIGYVVVLDTPYFGKTGGDGGLAVDAPAGRYRLQVWHPRLAGPAHEQTLTLARDTPLRVQVALALSAAVPARPANDRLRSLQDKFRRIEPAP